MYLKSNHVFEMTFKIGEGSITLPKSIYTTSQINTGKKTIIEVTQAQLDVLRNYNEFKSLEAKGDYTITNEEPAGYKSTAELVASKVEENNNLKAELEALKKEVATFKKGKKA